MTHDVKFAVVREDPRVEDALVEQVDAERALCVASGGDTALHLTFRHPELRVTAFDFNPAQLDHARRKADAIAEGGLARLNIGDASRDGLSQCGSFEALFRILRTAVTELVCEEAKLERFFEPDTDPSWRHEVLDRVTASAYWPRLFDTTFFHPLLDTMFGPEATQHAAPGSYPRYFQGVFEQGLADDDAHRNPFLQHILLGRYRPADAPDFLSCQRRLDVDWVHGTLLDVPGSLARFDLIHLSNIFDWSDDDVVESWSERLERECTEGTAIVIRQLNNERSLETFFEPAFAFDHALGDRLLAGDRSLFYNRILVGFRA